MKRRLKIVWRFVKKYIWLFMIAEICILATYLVSLLLPLNLSTLTDDVLYGKKYDLLNDVILNYIVLFLIAVIANSVYAFVWQTLSNRYIVDIKNEMYEKTICAKAN